MNLYFLMNLFRERKENKKIIFRNKSILLKNDLFL